ncbi:MAG: hypothetical protein ONB27_03750 [candidate division KSB1 bacterium]|nr:hypothetical protein [candidate division KSB1 bacterium]
MVGGENNNFFAGARGWRVLFLLPLLFLVCIATTNYYTARTLNRGEKVFTPGWDNLLLVGLGDKDDGKRWRFFLTPSLGLAVGVGSRVETGLRWYFPYLFEGALRMQLNPPSFRAFDVSANCHVVGPFLMPPLLKYGATISREIRGSQPFLSYYQYYPLRKEEDWDDFKDAAGAMLWRGHSLSAAIDYTGDQLPI